MPPSPVHNVGLTRRTLCSCGTADAHRVARREMYDGAFARFWSDGLIEATDHEGVTRYCRTASVRALWAVADSAGLYDARHLFAAVHWSSPAYRSHVEYEFALHEQRERPRREFSS